MLKYRVEVDGRGFNVPDEVFIAAARLGGRSIGEDVRSAVAPYPRATEANKPGRVKRVNVLSSDVVLGLTAVYRSREVKLGWYERGVGWHSPSGKLDPKKRSQRLGTKWQVIEAAEYKGSTVTITNSATYAPFAHGEKQARFHAKRGWKQIFKFMRSRARKGIIEAANQKVLQLLRGWR